MFWFRICGHILLAEEGCYQYTYIGYIIIISIIIIIILIIIIIII